MKKTSTIIALAALFAAFFVSCKDPDIPEQEEQPDYWNAPDEPYGIMMNPYNGDIVITTNGGNIAFGDCYVFDKNFKKRTNAITLGMFPSNAVALDESRLLILDEGSWGANNANVSFVDVAGSSAVANWFSNNNGRGLGDVAQDINLYGSKSYVSVTFSNSVEIIDNATGISTQISTANQAINPRYLAADGGNIYITCYSPACVLRLDTASESFTGSCALGNFNPEGICALGGKLYVCSSNISDENYNYSYDNKLYVIDISTFSLVDSITVGYNPAKVRVLDNNHVVVNTWGDYATHPEGTYLVNVNNKTATPLEVAFFNFDIYQGNIYGYTSPYSNSMKFYKLNPITGTKTQILAQP